MSTWDELSDDEREASGKGYDGAGSDGADSKIVDLMAALEQSVLDARAARKRHPKPEIDDEERWPPLGGD